jgi:hypothetical protein
MLTRPIAALRQPVLRPFFKPETVVWRGNNATRQTPVELDLFTKEHSQRIGAVCREIIARKASVFVATY